MDRKLRLELPDPPFRWSELGFLARRDASFDARVDTCLAAPGIDRLRAYPKLGGDLRHLPSAFDQIHDTAPELRRVTSSCHLVLLSPMAAKSSFLPTSKAGHPRASGKAGSIHPNNQPPSGGFSRD